VGCAVARALAARGERVLVLEKEPRLAMHQSGRNSGVLHAGMTYAPGSRKAAYCVAGRRAALSFARAHGVAAREVGKLVVAQHEAEVAVLQRLFTQGQANGAEGVRILDAAALREVEPHASGIAALHSPQSAIVDSLAFVAALARDAQDRGADLRVGAPLQAARFEDGAWRLRTSDGWEEAQGLVTCGGLQSDRLARACGYDHPYRVVPFRGQFYQLREGREHLVRGLLYPAPDPRFPFVGVHLTPRTDGSVLAGPNAVLAFGREAYGHVLQPQARDLASMALSAGFWRMLARPEVRAQARTELARAVRPARFLRAAQALVPALEPGDLVPSHSGIRAQLVDPRGQLVDDILLAEDAPRRALHVLNAVSPGLTCALPFGEDVAARSRALPG